MKLILEKNSTMKTMSTCLIDIKKKVAWTKTEKGLLATSNAELLSSARRKEAKSTRAGKVFIEAIPAIYLGFTFQIEKMSYRIAAKDRTLFATSNTF